MVRLYDKRIQTVTFLMRVTGFDIYAKLFLKTILINRGRYREIIKLQRTYPFSKKWVLKYAVQKHSPTHEYVISLNKPAKLTNVQKLMEKYKHG